MSLQGTCRSSLAFAANRRRLQPYEALSRADDTIQSSALPPTIGLASHGFR